MQRANPQAESELIGICMTNPEVIPDVGAQVSRPMFTLPAAAEVWDVMMALDREQKPINMVTVTERVQASTVVSLMPPDSVLLPLPALETCIRAVQDAYIARRLDALHRTGPQRIQDTDDIRDHLDKVQQELFELSQAQDSGDTVPLIDIVANRLEAYQRKTPNSVKTGFEHLDIMLSGMQRGDLIILAARPSMGKTSLARAILRNVARQGHSALFFSLEMSKEQQADMLIGAEAKIPGAILRYGLSRDQEWEAIAKAVGAIGNLPLRIDDTPLLTAADIRARARRHKSKFPNLGLVAVDYLGLLADKPERGENLDTLIGRQTRTLKLLARELQVPVLVLAQLNRQAESREGHRPILADLRSSGNIEQDADVVLMIYRDDYYNRESDERGIAEIIIAKQRNGPTGVVKLKWLPEYATFGNLDTRRQEGC